MPILNETWCKLNLSIFYKSNLIEQGKQIVPSLLSFLGILLNKVEGSFSFMSSSITLSSSASSETWYERPEAEEEHEDGSFSNSIFSDFIEGGDG